MGDPSAALAEQTAWCPRTDDRRVLNGIVVVLRTGRPWRDLHGWYGPSTTVYNRFSRGAKAGVWINVLNALAERSPEPMAVIDSSIIRAHRLTAGGKKAAKIMPSTARQAIAQQSAERGAPSWRIERPDQRVVDESGRPIRLSLRAGQASDKAAAPALIDSLSCAVPVVADRGYDAIALVEQIRS
ncbi:MAG: IS5 family transposase [Pseudomonadota bacterium]